MLYGSQNRQLFISLYSINRLITKTYFTYHKLKHTEILGSTHNAFICFACISEQTAIISVYTINLSIFITQAECLLCGTNGVFKSERYSVVFKKLTG
jgi:hypothetical protein